MRFAAILLVLCVGACTTGPMPALTASSCTSDGNYIMTAGDADLGAWALSARQRACVSIARDAAAEQAKQAQIDEAARQQVASEKAKLEHQARLAAQTRRPVDLSAQGRRLAAADAGQTSAVPPNYCSAPVLARGLLVKYVTTVQFEPDQRIISCHGTFLLASGGSRSGILSTRPNAVGDIVTTWDAD
jgi:hypothetical protein